MNQEVRKFLIDQCVKGEPIYYEVIGRMLKLDLKLESHRQILSRTLGEISAYEHENVRPLISSIAIYKQKNDHGYGFYSLCEELGIGKANKLSQKLYGFTQIEECKLFWQKAENYNAFAEFTEEKITYEIDFFTSREIDFLTQWSGKVYDKDNNEHVAAKNYIINSLGTKTQYWSNILANSLSEMETFNWRMWSQKGWKDSPEGKIRVTRFKHYTWARIFRRGDKNKDIFFTIGVDGKSRELVYKLDYYFEKNSNLNSSQKEIIENNIPKILRWQSISIENLKDYNWDTLVNLTTKFISENLHFYDKLIKLAWRNSEPSKIFSNFLRPQEKPKNGYSRLPELNPKFKGIDKDFVQESIFKKEIGDAGEELVKQYEINRLINAGHDDLADKVEIVKDGKGFDILSFNSKRKPRYIEVKTTTNGSLTPFDYTINEKLFAEKNVDSYYIYRLYNYDKESNTADFYVISQLEESVLMQPTTFKVYLKRQI